MTNYHPTIQEIADHASKSTKWSQERRKEPLLPARIRRLGAGALAVATLLFVGDQIRSANQTPEKTTTVEIGGGKYPTVWSLAEDISGRDTDIRETVHTILKLNPEIDPGNINGVVELRVPLSQPSLNVHDQQYLNANLPEDTTTHVR